MQWAKENNIASGITATEFGPTQNISREQMCVILVRFCQQFNIPLQSATSNYFADDKDISAYARDAVYIAKANGNINGIGDNKFAPKTSAKMGTNRYNFNDL